MQEQIFTTIPINDFKEVIKSTVTEVLNSVKPQPAENEDNYLTRRQTAEKLHLSLTTLDTYTRLGILKAKKVGNRVLYRKSDLTERLSEKTNTVKFKSK